MIVVMNRGASQPEVERVLAKLEREGFQRSPVSGGGKDHHRAIGDKTRLSAVALEAMSGVDKVVPLLQPF
jgi:3-deoxy-7-phosphoheptulonate synthase